MSAQSAIENIFVSGLEKRKQFLVFVINVLHSNQNSYQLTRRYVDFASFHRAIFLNEELTEVPQLPSFQALLTQVQQRNNSLLVPQLHLLTSYCKDVISSYPEDPFILEFFQQCDFDNEMQRKNLVKSPLSQEDDFIPKGEGYSEFIVLDAFNAGNLTFQTGDVVVELGNDSEGWSMVGRTVNEKLISGWIPSNYLIPKEDDPDIEDIHSYLLDVRTFCDSDEDKQLLNNVCYYEYTTTQKQAIIPTTSEPVILPEGTDVTVVDKDEDGWWYVSNHDIEGWFPSTVLEPRDNTIVPNPGDIDTLCIPEEGDPSADQCRGKTIVLHAQAAYKGSGVDEISFDQEASVEVLNKSLSGWWTVRVKGKVGLCPAVLLSGQRGTTRGAAVGVHYKIGFNSSLSTKFPPRRLKRENVCVKSPNLCQESFDNAQQILTETSQLQNIPSICDEAAEDFSYTLCSPGKKLVSSTIRKLQESPKAIRKRMKIFNRSKLDLQTPPESPPNTSQMEKTRNVMEAQMAVTNTRKHLSHMLRVAVPLDFPRSLPGSPVNERRKLCTESSFSDGEHSPPMSPVEGFSTAANLPNRFQSTHLSGAGNPGHFLSKLSPKSEVGSGEQISIPKRFKCSQRKQASPYVADNTKGTLLSSERKKDHNLHMPNSQPQGHGRSQMHSPELPRVTYTWDDDEDGDSEDNHDTFVPVCGKAALNKLTQQIASIPPRRV